MSQLLVLGLAWEWPLAGEQFVEDDAQRPDIRLRAHLIGLAAGAAVGFFNSYFITALKMADFIVTLGTLSLVRGIVELMTAQTRLNTQSEAFGFLASGTVLGVPTAVLIAAAVVIVGGLTLAKTPMGRTIYAVGLNPASSHLAGVRVQRVRVGVYVTSGVLAALAGILLASRLTSAHPALGTGYELMAIAAAAIGGTSLAGGRGSILGTVVGRCCWAFCKTASACFELTLSGFRSSRV